MRYQQFQSVSNHPERLFDPEIYQKCGTVEIRDVHYAISPYGFIYIQVSTNYPGWVNLVNKVPPISECRDGLILVNSEEICQNDVYDIYVLRNDISDDSDGFAQLTNTLTEYSYLAPHQNETAVIRWNLISSMPKQSGIKSVSIKHQLSECPICGSSLDTDDNTGECYCFNSDCGVHRYVKICRYINIACKLPQYQKLCKRFIDDGLIKSISDLYTTLSKYLECEHPQHSLIPEVSEEFKKKRWKKYGRVEEIQQFINDIKATQGTLKFSDWLQSTPYLDIATCWVLIEDPTKLVNHEVIKGTQRDYICPDNLDKYFQKHPDHFIQWTQDLFVCYIESEMDYLAVEPTKTKEEGLAEWKQQYGSEIEHFMSFSVFFQITEMINELESDLQELITLNLFAPDDDTDQKHENILPK